MNMSWCINSEQRGHMEEQQMDHQTKISPLARGECETLREYRVMKIICL